MTKRMADGAYIETKDTSWADVLTAYGPNFGSTQGPWNIQPFNWLAAQTKPTWVIFFPGADPAKCLAYCRQFPHVKGAMMDVEARWEHDPWTLATVKSWGDQMAVIPRVIYSHRWYCDSQMGHYDGKWVAGEPNQGDPGPACAVQWNYQTALGYDESIANDYYANPSGVYVPATGGAPSTGETSDMTPQEISAVVKLAYRLAGSPNADATDPKGFGDQVDAVVSGAVNLHEVVNNILATGALAAGPKGDKGDQGVPGPTGPAGPPGASGSGTSFVAPHHHAPGDVQ